MATDSPPPKVSSDIAGIRAPGNFQAIEATYYSLTDSDSRSLAALLVLLDSLHRPVRAELYLYEEAAGQTREHLVRQAQQILQGRYYSRQAVPLRILDINHESDGVQVTLPETPQPGSMSRASTGRTTGRRWWPAALGAVILLLMLGLATRWFFGRSSSETAAPAGTPAAGTSVIDAPASEESDAAANPGRQFVSNENLPPSANADPTIQVGVRVRVDPQYRSYILREPNPLDENIIGDLAPGEEMTVQEGPVLREGESDTIVWWYVVTDDGREGWVPANTSQVTVLRSLP